MPRLRSIRIALAAVAVAAVGAGLWGYRAAHTGSTPPAPSPSPAVAAPDPAADADPVIATVGGRPILASDLDRFAAVRALFLSGRSEQQSLVELVDRALLARVAEEERIALAPEEREAALARRRMLGSALAAGPRGKGHAPPLPDPLTGFLERRALTEAELLAEVEADLVAEKVKQARVYDRIDVPDEDVAREAAALGAEPEPELIAAIRRRRARSIGRQELATYVDSLRARWPVELRPR